MARPARARVVGGVDVRRRAFWLVSVASSRERRERRVWKKAAGGRGLDGMGCVALSFGGMVVVPLSVLMPDGRGCLE